MQGIAVAVASDNSCDKTCYGPHHSHCVDTDTIITSVPRLSRICCAGDADDEQLMPNDQLPSEGRVGIVSMRWRCFHSVSGAVLGIVAVGTAICLLLMTFFTYMSLQYSTTRHIWSLPYVSHWNTGIKASIGVLSSGSFLDEEIYSTAQYAAREHHSQFGNGEIIDLQLAYTNATISGLIFAFEKLWGKGIRVFLTSVEDPEVKALCQHLQKSGKQALIVSPTAFQPSFDCPQLFSIYPEHGALIAAEVARIKNNGITHIIPVVSDTEMKTITQLQYIAKMQGIAVEHSVQLQTHNISILRLRETLLIKPRAAVWLSLGRNLPQLLPIIGNELQGHFIIMHTHPSMMHELFRYPAAKRMAEINAVCSSEWIGSSPVGTVARRRFLIALQPKDPLVAALAYDIVSLILSGLMNNPTSDMHALKSTMIKNALQNGIIYSRETSDDPTTGYVVLKRLVMQRLIGKVVLQDFPWLMEGTAKVSKKGHLWSVVQQTHSPVYLITKEEIVSLAKKRNCSNLWVKIIAHDPISHLPVTTAWIPSDAPELLLLPNGSPKGFVIQALCRDSYEAQLFEFGCQGNEQHNDSLVCVTVSGVSGNRRSVRNAVSSYSSYSNYDYYDSYSSYSSYPSKKKKYPLWQQQVDGPFSFGFKQLKKYFTNEEFKSIIPQIGGCLGATGGCAFCFAFLLFNPIAVQPGVCFGACSVAVGGSCTTLLAKGVQYKLDQSVICTELFTQGRLPLSSYLADGLFGSRLAAANPQALRGYQALAAPIVAAMQVSPAFSSAVESIARPWMVHMEYDEGLRPDDNTLGRLMTGLGLPLCTLMAVVLDHLDTITIVALLAFFRRSRT